MKIIHHYNCTYCKHYKNIKKFIDKKHDLETCLLTGNKIPARYGRHCDHYQQVNCPCEACNSSVPGGSHV